MNEVFIKRVGEQLRIQRRKLYYSRADVSAMTGLTVNTISSIENGGQITLAHFELICRAIQLQPRDVIPYLPDLNPLYPLPPQRENRRLTSRRVRELLKSGFFDKPRLVSTVIGELHTTYGVLPTSTEVSTNLQNLAHKGLLEVFKTGRKNTYQARSGKPNK